MTAYNSQLYDFIFRGLLTEESLDRDGRKTRHVLGMADPEIATAISLDSLDDVHLANSRSMAVVYTAIAAFENGVRELVVRTLVDKYKEEWWEKGFTAKVRDTAEKRMKDEQNAKWHSQRGDDPINYTNFGNLKSAMNNNWDEFEGLIGSLSWATGIFEVVERSRNVIMHSGTLDREDIDRLGVNIRDWVKQVGT